MFGLVLLYFVGKAFYDLAAKHGKSKWGFGILGVVSYYAGLMIGGIIIAILIELFSSQSVEDFSDWALGLMALPIGVLSCWGLYKILERQWSASPRRFASEDVLDAELPLDNNQQ